MFPSLVLLLTLCLFLLSACLCCDAFASVYIARPHIWGVLYLRRKKNFEVFRVGVFSGLSSSFLFPSRE